MATSPKTCFVTIGATASFAALIRAALSSDTLSALSKLGYTDLVVQYGQDGKELFDSAMQQVKTAGSINVNVTGFDLDKAGLGKYMRQAKGGSGSRGGQEGVVVSHAGMFMLLPSLFRLYLSRACRRTVMGSSVHEAAFSPSPPSSQAPEPSSTRYE